MYAYIRTPWSLGVFSCHQNTSLNIVSDFSFALSLLPTRRFLRNTGPSLQAKRLRNSNKSRFHTHIIDDSPMMKGLLIPSKEDPSCERRCERIVVLAHNSTFGSHVCMFISKIQNEKYICYDQVLLRKFIWRNRNL